VHDCEPPPARGRWSGKRYRGTTFWRQECVFSGRRRPRYSCAALRVLRGRCHHR
jgi:hypothetical protein